MSENCVRNSDGDIIGYRCRICEEVFQSMWGDTCNSCRELQKQTCKKVQFQVENPQAAGYQKDNDKLNDRITNLERSLAIAQRALETQKKIVFRYDFDMLKQLFKDHYWDSMSDDKDLIIQHIEAVIDCWLGMYCGVGFKQATAEIDKETTDENPTGK